jgi:hypothetical protein
MEPKTTTTTITYFTTSKLYNRNLQSLKRKKNKPTKIEKHIHNNVNKLSWFFLMQPFFSLNTRTNDCPLIPHLQSIAFTYHVDVYQYGYTYTYNKLKTMVQISKSQR